MYVRYGNDPQAEAILTTLQSQSGVQMDYRATAAYRNDALNLQYLPQLTQAYQQLPPLNGSMSQAQFARYAGLLSGDFTRIPPAAQREVVQQLQSEYQTTLKQQLAQDQAGQSAGSQALQLAARLNLLNKLLATAEYAAVHSGAISESEAGAMQRAMATGMLVPSQGVNAKPQGVPPAKGQVVAGENMPAGQSQGSVFVQNKVPSAEVDVSTTGIVDSPAVNNATYQPLKNQLYEENLQRIAAYDARLATAVNGGGGKNFSIGTGSAVEADYLGKVWVGDGAKLVSNQVACPGCLKSADGLRIYRPPSNKPNMPAEFTPTGMQANFVKLSLDGKIISNGHLVVIP